MHSNIFRALLFTQVLLAVPPGSSQQTPATHPGSAPYTPTRIDWLTTTLQANLRSERLEEDGYILQITSPNPETIRIYVRYLPTVNREAMNTGIDAAREVIHITAKSYGWDGWLKVTEDIQIARKAR
jgi:hypothetical protein